MSARMISHLDTAMGTIIQETVYTTDAEEDSVQDIILLLRELEEEVLSRRLETSQIYQINEAAAREEGCKLSEKLQEYLEIIGRISKESKGALDITVGEVTELWNLDEWAAASADGQAGFTVPPQDQLEDALRCTGYEKVVLSEGRIYLPEGMKLDLGAVGKGIACDEIGAYLKEQEHIKGASIAVGGSVITYGEKPDGSSWNIAVMHPRKEGELIGTLSLRGEWYISTSGDYERYIDKDGIRYHHIIDPDTGYPVDNEVCSVTIVSKSGLLSDALSTACFVMGAEEGLRLAQAYGAEALIFTKNLHTYETTGMESMFRELSN